MPRRTPRPRRAARLAPALVAPLLALGCATGTAPSAPVPPPAPTTTVPPDPVVACAGQLVYWAEQDLAGVVGEAYDYQHRGLTSEQNDALAVLEERARAEGWTPAQLAEQARTACVAVVAANPQGF